MDDARDALVRRAAALIARPGDSVCDDGARDGLLLEIARWQAERIEPYRRLVRARGVDPARARSPSDMPAVPTDVCRVARVAAHPAAEDARVFLTSGTTSGARGAHHLRDLSLYDAAARTEGQRALFGDRRPIRCVSLVPAETEVPESSLSYMVARFHEWFGAAGSCHVWRRGQLDVQRFASVLDDAVASEEPVCLLGTSFAFVFAEGDLCDRRFQLPPGSRIMQTGGFKGRTRAIEPTEMRSLLSSRYGVPDAWIVGEYGMTELSSQMYEGTLADALQGVTGLRRLRCPPWVRLAVCDPETLAPLSHGAPGLLRIEDAANVDTMWAVQTSDVARRVGDGIILLGRDAGATPRGCSLAVEEALGPREIR